MIDIKPEEQGILDYWNEQSKIGGYKPHRSLLADAHKTIKQIIKEGYTYEQIKSAIKNYTFVISDDRFYFKWNKWTLKEFLSRGAKDDKGARWLWFIDDYFNEEKWLTKEEKNRIIMERENRNRREKMNNSKPINMPPNLTQKILKKDETPVRNFQAMKLALLRSEK